MNEAQIAALPGGLKFVRWSHTPKQGSRDELKVKKGYEVYIITLPKEDDEEGWYKVENETSGKIGYIPKRCFYPRRKVKFPFTGQETGELSVTVNEVIGVINEDTEDDMWLAMKENGTTGKIPVRCFYPSYKAYVDHKASKREELSVNKGDNIGIIDKNRNDGYWMGYFRGETGLVPSKCFEAPIKVFFDYEAEQEGDLTVKESDMVTIVDHEETSTPGKIRVHLANKIGYIPKRCFETLPIQVYKGHDQRQKNEISVTKGQVVDMFKDVDSPEGYFTVCLEDTAGLVPTECFEIPARVIVDYKSKELSVKNGDEVTVMNPMAKVRRGHEIGHIPLKCIHIEARVAAQKRLPSEKSTYNEDVTEPKRSRM